MSAVLEVATILLAAVGAFFVTVILLGALLAWWLNRVQHRARIRARRAEAEQQVQLLRAGLDAYDVWEEDDDDR